MIIKSPGVILFLSFPFGFHDTRSPLCCTCATERRAAESLVFAPPVKAAERKQGGEGRQLARVCVCVSVYGGGEGNPWLPYFFPLSESVLWRGPINDPVMVLRAATLSQTAGLSWGDKQSGLNSQEATDPSAGGLSLTSSSFFFFYFFFGFTIRTFWAFRAARQSRQQQTDQWSKAATKRTWSRSRKASGGVGASWISFSACPSWFCSWRWRLWLSAGCWWWRSCAPSCVTPHLEAPAWWTVGPPLQVTR